MNSNKKLCFQNKNYFVSKIMMVIILKIILVPNENIKKINSKIVYYFHSDRSMEGKMNGSINGIHQRQKDRSIDGFI